MAKPAKAMKAMKAAKKPTKPAKAMKAMKQKPAKAMKVMKQKRGMKKYEGDDSESEGEGDDSESEGDKAKPRQMKPGALKPDESDEDDEGDEAMKVMKCGHELGNTVEMDETVGGKMISPVLFIGRYGGLWLKINSVAFDAK